MFFKLPAFRTPINRRILEIEMNWKAKWLKHILAKIEIINSTN